MRQNTRREILKLSNSMHEAHIQIKKQAAANQIEAAITLLSDCQAAAVQIGETIEATEGPETPAVKELETYCEVLYQISMDLKPSAAHKQYKIIEKSFNHFLHEISLMPVCFEILFLPYKASMWDSLESIWQAAAEDNSCDCYVAPIPYYEKDVNGTFIKECYEGTLFPDYVPITDWKAYELEKRKPDIIYIHNPYDDCNRVTSIHPQYYCSNLKKYTDMLVYVPYFAAVDGEIPEHLCVLPGILYADKVIVQNKREQGIYQKAYKDFLKTRHLEGRFADGSDKFLPLGSPKFDRVMTYNKENIDTPKEWLDKIKGKKVLLYNTSIQEVLIHKEKYLDKICAVIDCIEKQKDIVLLWRPHPLLSATLHSMLPELEKRYLNIVDQYKKKNIGIYDDTVDVERAIILSDFYYGDASSLVAMYEKTGKAVLIQKTFD